MSTLRNTALISLAAITALASGCVVEPVHPRHPRQEVVVEQPVYREQVEVVAPQAPPEWVVQQVDTRPGYVWARGYWRWDGRRYVAVRGHWEVARPGYHYVHPHWEHRRDGWHWRAGVWLRG
ncbi:MAG TPA: YXWGXW repeat-containing protein [Rhodanobacter sp.]|nr:YXWGXW repeat-containing protein [Rhodanobacter sp.]